MNANDHGPHVLARLLGGLPVDPHDLDSLGEPWRGLSRAVRAAVGHEARTDALLAALADRPDRAAIRAAISAAIRLVAHPAATSPGDADTLVSLADVPTRPVRWLWADRLPIGKLTVLDGDPGLGKSAITLDVAARVSAGLPMPDRPTPDPSAGSGQALDAPRGVVLLSAEDGLADTIRPRLLAAGADLARIVALTSVLDRPLSHSRPGGPGRPIFRLPTLGDLSSIRRAIAKVRAALVVVDPIMAFLPRDVDSGRDSAVRAPRSALVLLIRLAGLAEAEDVAVLVVRHLTKRAGRNPLYRGGGSIGIIGAARSGLLVARNPADPTGARRVLASTKANLVHTPPALAYRLATADGAHGAGSLRVVWEGPTDQTASSLLDASAAPARHEPTALDEARDLLRSVLAAGPSPSDAVFAEARAAGISPITLRRARAALGIRPRKDGFRGCWLWELPSDSADR